MKMYKGFTKDLRCRDFKYEIGKEYRTDDADLCNSGFHACENPLDTFNYYAPALGSRYCEVELDKVSEQRGEDSKRCGKIIRIGAELDVAGICKAHFEYVKARCIPARTNAAGDGEAASAGEQGMACVRGGRVKGGLGCAICCTELDDGGNNIGIAAAIVDGKTIKADTWYTAKSGWLVEVEA